MNNRDRKDALLVDVFFGATLGKNFVVCTLKVKIPFDLH